MLKVEEVSKIYPNGSPNGILALDKVSIDIEKGEFVVILGPSGAGKSTLLRCINRLVDPTEGKIFFMNGESTEEITLLKGKNLRRVRQEIAMVFQQFNLVRRLNCLQNVICGRLAEVPIARSLFYSFPEEDIEFALDCLEKVELGREYAFRRVSELSGGQQQRVGIARALAQRPEVILADEPVSSLDPRTARLILGLLKKINKQEKITVIVNLHAVDLAKEYAERIIGLSNGRVVFEGAPTLLDSHLKTIYYEEETINKETEVKKCKNINLDDHFDLDDHIKAIYYEKEIIEGKRG